MYSKEKTFLGKRYGSAETKEEKVDTKLERGTKDDQRI